MHPPLSRALAVAQSDIALVSNVRDISLSEAEETLVRQRWEVRPALADAEGEGGAEGGAEGEGGALKRLLRRIGKSTEEERLGTSVCPICQDDFDAETVEFEACGHKACRECAQQYTQHTVGELVAGTNEGLAGSVPCPTCLGQGTPAPGFLSPGKVGRLVDADTARQFVRARRQLLPPNQRFCSRPGCDLVVSVSLRLAQKAAGRGLDVECACGARFCFVCGSSAHAPATCGQMRNWIALSDTLAQTTRGQVAARNQAERQLTNAVAQTLRPEDARNEGPRNTALRRVGEQAGANAEAIDAARELGDGQLVAFFAMRLNSNPRCAQALVRAVALHGNEERTALLLDEFEAVAAEEAADRAAFPLPGEQEEGAEGAAGGALEGGGGGGSAAGEQGGAPQAQPQAQAQQAPPPGGDADHYFPGAARARARRVDLIRDDLHRELAELDRARGLGRDELPHVAELDTDDDIEMELMMMMPRRMQQLVHARAVPSAAEQVPEGAAVAAEDALMQEVEQRAAELRGQLRAPRRRALPVPRSDLAAIPSEAAVRAGAAGAGASERKSRSDGEAAPAVDPEKESETFIARNTKDCPKCFTACLHAGGCAHMICSKCGHHWCFDCLGDWKALNGYQHLATCKGPAAARTQADYEKVFQDMFGNGKATGSGAGARDSGAGGSGGGEGKPERDAWIAERLRRDEEARSKYALGAVQDRMGLEFGDLRRQRRANAAWALVEARAGRTLRLAADLAAEQDPATREAMVAQAHAHFAEEAPHIDRLTNDVEVFRNARDALHRARSDFERESVRTALPFIGLPSRIEVSVEGAGPSNVPAPAIDAQAIRQEAQALATRVLDLRSRHAVTLELPPLQPLFERRAQAPAALREAPAPAGPDTGNPARPQHDPALTAPAAAIAPAPIAADVSALVAAAPPVAPTAAAHAVEAPVAAVNAAAAATFNVAPVRRPAPGVPPPAARRGGRMINPVGALQQLRASEERQRLANAASAILDGRPVELNSGQATRGAAGAARASVPPPTTSAVEVMQSHSLRTAALDARALLASCKRTLTCAEVATLMRTIATDGAGGPPPASAEPGTMADFLSETLRERAERLQQCLHDAGLHESAMLEAAQAAAREARRAGRPVLPLPLPPPAGAQPQEILTDAQIAASIEAGAQPGRLRNLLEMTERARQQFVAEWRLCDG